MNREKHLTTLLSIVPCPNGSCNSQLGDPCLLPLFTGDSPLVHIERLNRYLDLIDSKQPRNKSWGIYTATTTIDF